MAILAQLQDRDTRRSKSARKLAEFVLADPESVLSMPISSLAAAVSVSEPTVNRFCTGLGLKGFPDFKLTLAAELARGQSRMARDVEYGDSTSQVIAKVFDSTHASLVTAEENLGGEDVDAVVRLLAGARSIVLCGLGASASVALDAQHKLLRFDTPVMAHTDIINQRMITAGLGGRDCLVCVSYTGRTTAMVELARLGCESGVRVIGLTAPNSPLARHCERVLGVGVNEDTDSFTPMTSRIAQLAVLDVLTMRLALSKGPRLDKRLQRVKDSLVATREPGN